MMRREVVVACGGYDERYRYAADYALWSALVRRGHRIANLSEPLMKYREFRESLGAVHKLGAAGDESAEIIAANAATLAGLTLSPEEAREIALLFFPAAGLPASGITRAYMNLRTLARRSYGRIPLRTASRAPRGRGQDEEALRPGGNTLGAQREASASRRSR
jgi:hypothetical protein